jgi:hypothetical protein
VTRQRLARLRHCSAVTKGRKLILSSFIPRTIYATIIYFIIPHIVVFFKCYLFYFLQCFPKNKPGAVSPRQVFFYLIPYRNNSRTFLKKIGKKDIEKLSLNDKKSLKKYKKSIAKVSSL